MLLPAIISGFAALFRLIVLNTSNSTLKCTRAARKEMRVAPAHTLGISDYLMKNSHVCVHGYRDAAIAMMNREVWVDTPYMAGTRGFLAHIRHSAHVVTVHVANVLP